MLRPRSRLLERVARFALTNRLSTAVAAAMSAGHATVFLLHRFADSPATGRGFPIPTLIRHFEWLRRHRYRIVGLASLVEDLTLGRKIPARTVAFTVDDGYSDFLDLALPHFRHFDIPATVFLVTAFLDRKCWLWWDRVEVALLQDTNRPLNLLLEGETITIPSGTRSERLKAIDTLVERLKSLTQSRRDAAIDEICREVGVALPALPTAEYAPMTWDQVREVSGDLVSFGPHTLSHPILARESDADVRREIAGSWARLQAELPTALPIFCYPNGDCRSFGRRELDVVAEVGLTASLSVLQQPIRATDFPDVHALRSAALPRYSLEEDYGRFVQVVSGMERLKSLLLGTMCL